MSIFQLQLLLAVNEQASKHSLDCYSIPINTDKFPVCPFPPLKALLKLSQYLQASLWKVEQYLQAQELFTVFLFNLFHQMFAVRPIMEHE